MRVLALAGDAASLMAQIRLRAPLQALCQRMGWPFELRSLHDCGPAELAAADVLIVQRGLSRRAWRLQKAMRQRGGAVVYEIDDLLTDVPPHISNHEAIWAAQPWLRRCLAECDLVTTSTARLALELGPPCSRVVPNCAWPPVEWDLPEADAQQPVTLLLASMEALATEFIYPGLRAAQAAGARIVVVGPAAAGFAAAGLPVQAQELIPRDRFIAFARGLPNVVAVVPLESSRFAACKSAIKWFEYAGAGIPVLCSAVSPYADVVQPGVTGELVPNEAGAWQAALFQATDAAWRHRIAAAAQADVRRRFTFDHMVTAWQQALELALQRRAATGVMPATWAWRAQETLAASLDAPLRGLRRLNRARLARRKQGA